MNLREQCQNNIAKYRQLVQYHEKHALGEFDEVTLKEIDALKARINAEIKELKKGECQMSKDKTVYVRVIIGDYKDATGYIVNEYGNRTKLCLWHKGMKMSKLLDPNLYEIIGPYKIKK